MTVISSDLETPAQDAGPDKARQRRSEQNPRHKRSRRKLSLIWTFRRRLDKMLRTRQLFRIGFALLPLAGFIYVSQMNDVGGPDEDASSSIPSERSSVNSDRLTGSDTEALKSLSFYPDLPDDRLAGAPTNAQPAVSVTRQASTWPTGDPGASKLLPDGADGAPVDRTTGEPRATGKTATGSDFKKTTTYAVNEGGSLWRTGKRFIDDEVLLDELIDNLADSGMDVRSVRPGVEFIVNDLGSEGLLVLIDESDYTYESHILGESVTTSVRRQAEIEGDSSSATSLYQ